jgi:hypothetical protein
MQHVNGQYYLMLKPLKRLSEDLIKSATLGHHDLEMMYAIERNEIVENRLRYSTGELYNEAVEDRIRSSQRCFETIVGYKNVAMEAYIRMCLKESADAGSIMDWRKLLDDCLRREREAKK